MKPSIDEILRLSRFYGRDPEWVIAGGGNSSVKNDQTLLVKASGTSLATASKESFVAIDRGKLRKMWEASYPDSADAREAEALQDLMDSRLEGEKLRPSVETGMHDAFPQELVFHTHPTVINGLTCGQEGEKAARELFGEELVWIPSINPGYVLSKRIGDEIAAYRKRFGKAPQLLFLQNHGVTVAADREEEIHELHRRLLAAVLGRLQREPDLSMADVDLQRAERVKVALIETFSALTGERPTVLFEATRELLDRAESRQKMSTVLQPFSPDHIVYAGHAPLYVEDSAKTADRFRSATAEHGVPPKTVVVRDLGHFSVGANPKAAETARMLYRDAVKIAAYAESFGGAKPMEKEEIDFIRGWEVEKFRANVSLQ